MRDHQRQWDCSEWSGPRDYSSKVNKKISVKNQQLAISTQSYQGKLYVENSQSPPVWCNEHEYSMRPSCGAAQIKCFVWFLYINVTAILVATHVMGNVPISEFITSGQTWLNPWGHNMKTPHSILIPTWWNMYKGYSPPWFTYQDVPLHPYAKFQIGLWTSKNMVDTKRNIQCLLEGNQMYSTQYGGATQLDRSPQSSTKVEAATPQLLHFCQWGIPWAKKTKAETDRWCQQRGQEV